MYNIGVASFSGTLSKEYLKKVNEIGQTKLINQENIQLKIQEADCIIIPDNSDDDNAMTRTLNTIMEIKERTNKLIWVLTHDKNSVKNIIFLKLGVDGVIPANNFPEEFTLVMKNALCRQQNDFNKTIYNQKKIDAHSDPYMEFADKTNDVHKVELYPSNLSIVLDGEKEVNLTRLEYRTFEMLYQNRNKVVSYEEIYDFVWKSSIDNQQYRVANIIFHIRRKLKATSDNDNLIKTVRSIGYRLTC
ncbi:hypothetical protein IGL98_001456 [Enterococcus sp. DIV0840]|uniref:winged helix-turn-helix domain-containing protein n=1 Tax=Enterococcus TaxID=1350 RepID=UPI001A8DD265|nr:MULTISPECIES: winged helix-turn-helix domain-containing protein [Enterococcus]MBO0434494.1 winged helix-turn-helix domain-containing protein [Enterococcus sp. DIV0849a]MBO0472890.1 winged helix-turn-helix domain-containing protein [Enterococcus ureasiticus]